MRITFEHISKIPAISKFSRPTLNGNLKSKNLLLKQSTFTTQRKGKKNVLMKFRKVGIRLFRYSIFAMTRDIMSGTIFLQLCMGVAFMSITNFDLEMVRIRASNNKLNEHREFDWFFRQRNDWIWIFWYSSTHCCRAISQYFCTATLAHWRPINFYNTVTYRTSLDGTDYRPICRHFFHSSLPMPNGHFYFMDSISSIWIWMRLRKWWERYSATIWCSKALQSRRKAFGA